MYNLYHVHIHVRIIYVYKHTLIYSRRHIKRLRMACKNNETLLQINHHHAHSTKFIHTIQYRQCFHRIYRQRFNLNLRVRVLCIQYNAIYLLATSRCCVWIKIVCTLVFWELNRNLLWVKGVHRVVLTIVSGHNGGGRCQSFFYRNANFLVTPSLKKEKKSWCVLDVFNSIKINIYGRTPDVLRVKRSACVCAKSDITNKLWKKI